MKADIARVLRWTKADALLGRLDRLRRMPVIIGYHRVVEDFPAAARHAIPAMLISRPMLERHLDWIGRRYRFVPLDEVGERLERGEPFAEPVAAVTFDDGYRDVYDYAFPLLKRKGIPAAFFVVTDLIGTSHAHLHDTLYCLLAQAFATRPSAPYDLARLLLGLGLRLPQIGGTGGLARDPFTAMRILLGALPQARLLRVVEALQAEVEINESDLAELQPLSWQMLSEMHRSGMIIGSHTKAHVLLTNEGFQTALEETAGSRQELEQRLEAPIEHFTYPDGRFTATTVRTVAASGYRFGYTSCQHRDPVFPLLTIPRRILWQNSCLDARDRFSPAIMSCQMHGIFTIGCRQHHGWPRHQGEHHGANAIHHQEHRTSRPVLRP